MSLRKDLQNNPLRTISLAAIAGLTLAKLSVSHSIDPWFLALLPLLIWTIVADAKLMIIPNLCNGLIAILAFVALLLSHPADWLIYLLAAFVTFGVLLSIDLAYSRVRGYSGLGMGDIKLLSACALWVGPEKIGAVVLLAAGSAIAFIFARSLTMSPRTLASPHAFGPFIVMALWAQLTILP